MYIQTFFLGLKTHCTGQIKPVDASFYVSLYFLFFG